MLETFYFRLKCRGLNTRYVSEKAPKLLDAYDRIKRDNPRYTLEVMEQESWEKAKRGQEYWNQLREREA